MSQHRHAFDPDAVNVLASLVLELEDELTDDEPLNHVTRAALARRVVHFAQGESDRCRIRALVLNRAPSQKPPTPVAGAQHVRLGSVSNMDNGELV